MATSDDINTMAALADTEVDRFLGGHSDDNLATLYASTIYKQVKQSGFYWAEALLGLIGELINKVYDLEHP